MEFYLLYKFIISFSFICYFISYIKNTWEFGENQIKSSLEKTTTLIKVTRSVFDT